MPKKMLTALPLHFKPNFLSHRTFKTYRFLYLPPGLIQELYRQLALSGMICTDLRKDSGFFSLYIIDWFL
jgi:hypothetical protein